MTDLNELARNSAVRLSKCLANANNAVCRSSAVLGSTYRVSDMRSRIRILTEEIAAATSYIPFVAAAGLLDVSDAADIRSALTSVRMRMREADGATTAEDLRCVVWPRDWPADAKRPSDHIAFAVGIARSAESRARHAQPPV